MSPPDPAGRASAAVRLVEADPRRESSRQLALLLRELRAAHGPRDLLEVAAAVAPGLCGFERCLVLPLQGDRLGPGLLGTRVMGRARGEVTRSEQLFSLESGTAEYELVRQAESDRMTVATTSSCLRPALGLQAFALAVVIPVDRAMAVLAFDRPQPAVETADLHWVQVFSHLLAQALERVCLLARMNELALELRHLTASAHATMREALEAPLLMPADYGFGPVLAARHEIGGISDGASREATDGPREPLTVREEQIARQMVAGRSNREIAAELHLSPETVKGHVARILRKLGAANRVSAVSRYLQLVGDA